MYEIKKIKFLKKTDKTFTFLFLPPFNFLTFHFIGLFQSLYLVKRVDTPLKNNPFALEKYFYNKYH